MEQELVRSIVTEVISRMSACNFEGESSKPIPIGISNRHVHLSKSDLEVLFGPGYELKCRKELSQPGQYAAAETVILAGPKGCVEQVRVLGPVRKQTQAEILKSDGFRLGVKAPTRESGKLKDSSGITIIGPKGTVVLAEGVITAQRHIHMTPKDADFYRVADGQSVRVESAGERGMVFNNVVVRVNDNFALEFHIDMDEANAAGLSNGDKAYLLAVGSGSQSHGLSEKQVCYPTVHTPLKLVTEEVVRNAWKRNTELAVCKETLYTPLARDAIKELKVKLI